MLLALLEYTSCLQIGTSDVHKHIEVKVDEYDVQDYVHIHRDSLLIPFFCVRLLYNKTQNCCCEKLIHSLGNINIICIYLINILSALYSFHRQTNSIAYKVYFYNPYLDVLM